MRKVALTFVSVIGPHRKSLTCTGTEGGYMRWEKIAQKISDEWSNSLLSFNI